MPKAKASGDSRNIIAIMLIGFASITPLCGVAIMKPISPNNAPDEPPTRTGSPPLRSRVLAKGRRLRR